MKFISIIIKNKKEKIISNVKHKSYCNLSKKKKKKKYVLKLIVLFEVKLT